MKVTTIVKLPFLAAAVLILQRPASAWTKPGLVAVAVATKRATSLIKPFQLGTKVKLEDLQGKHTEAQNFDVLEIETLTVLQGDPKRTVLRNGKNYYTKVSFGQGVSEEVNMGRVRKGAESMLGRAGITTSLEENNNDLTVELFRRKGAGLSDEHVGTATISKQELTSDAPTFQAETEFVKSGGQSTGTKLMLKLRNSSWSKSYKKEAKKTIGVDTFYKLAIKMLGVETADTKNPRAHDIPRPHRAAEPDLPLITLMNGTLTFPEFADDVPVSRIKKAAMVFLNKLPFPDRQTTYKNRADAIREMAKLNAEEPFEGRWDNPNSDASLSRFYFNAIGQWAIAKDKSTGGYVADTTKLFRYKHRTAKDSTRPFQQYGCKTYFDGKGKITKIIDQDEITYFPDGTYIDKTGEVKTNPKYWDWAKLLARTSGFAVSSIEHLAQTHLMWGNYPGTAMRKFLPPTHPIRQAFSVHFFRTSNTLLRAQHFLFHELSLLLRSTSWDYRTGLERFYKDMMTKDFTFKAFPEQLKDKGLDGDALCVASKDGVELHQIFTKYAASYIDTIYESEAKLQEDTDFKKCHEFLVKKLNPCNKDFPHAEYNLKNVKAIWGEILFRVTGYHSSSKFSSLSPPCSIVDERKSHRTLLSCLLCSWSGL